MRKLLSFHVTSVDGYYEGPGQAFDWPVVDEEFNQFALQQLEEADMLLFGRATYQMMAGYWPTPAAKQDDPAVTAKMNDMAKIVISRTLDAAEWAHTQLITEDVAEVVAKLKQQPGQNMVILGSSALTVSLIGMGLVDEVPGRGEPGRARRRRVPVPDRRGTDRPDAPAGQVFPLRQCLAPLPARCPVRRRPRSAGAGRARRGRTRRGCPPGWT